MFIVGGASGMRKTVVATSLLKEESGSLEKAQAIIREYCRGCDPSGVQHVLEKVFIKHETAVQEHEATIASLRQALGGLRKALQALYDEQNGPPLKGAKTRWERAMRLSEAALDPAGVANHSAARGGAGVRKIAVANRKGDRGKTTV
jgi:hypothetical protein